MRRRAPSWRAPIRAATATRWRYESLQPRQEPVEQRAGAVKRQRLRQLEERERTAQDHGDQGRQPRVAAPARARPLLQVLDGDGARCAQGRAHPSELVRTPPLVDRQSVHRCNSSALFECKRFATYARPQRVGVDPAVFCAVAQRCGGTACTISIAVRSATSRTTRSSEPCALRLYSRPAGEPRKSTYA